MFMRPIPSPIQETQIWESYFDIKKRYIDSSFGRICVVPISVKDGAPGICEA